MKPIRLISGLLTVGGWTLMSRVLGFFRDIIIAAFLGPGPVMDAFVAAFRLPNMFRRFFAEGAFNSAFVPMFSKKYEAGDNYDGFASLALSGLALVLVLLSALAMIFMPALVWITAGGFSGDPRFDLTVDFGRIAFPYILFISLAALFSGVLNASGRFAAAAAAPVLLNIILVTGMVGAAWSGGAIEQVLIWAIPVAGVAQLALVWGAARKAGFKITPVRPRWTPEIRHLVAVAVPAALAGGVVQVNLVVGQLVASSYDKAVSWLYAADRLYQLPLGVVGIAVGIVLLPDLSRRLRAEDSSGAKTAYSRAGEISLALTVPSAVALVVIPWALVSVLFERGATGPEDSLAMARAVAVYGLGLPAFVLQKLMQPLYFAREDTRTPFRFAVVAMVINAVIAIGLSPVLGWISAAWAATVSGWAMVILLWLGARRFGDVAQFDARFKSRIGRIAVASVGMGLCLWAAEALLHPYLMLDSIRYLALILLILIGIVTYFGLGQAIGAFRLAEFKSALRRSG